MNSHWQACAHYLIQASELVEKLDQVQYTAPHARCFGSTIGGHVRHCLEHFQSFRNGLSSGRIDYDARERGTPEETDPAAARFRIHDLADWYAANREPGDTRVAVKVDCGAAYDALWADSSVGRELQFLVSHTIHHFALIAVLCESQGIPLPKDFGVAPSTLRHRKEVAARA